ncbi:Uncharacterised protein [Nocardia otitidiscaviarum]|uniref:DUF8175 domain-containing protein n=1 Tax=Nocardia otitidiscaviarum TaxID=1823 RepID=A0A379JMB6_9NOCA|nr:hypothetical protein [Nocardia otitidiscaviarum]SUD49580.1 Uncharacterised protein [Nocardia otitidiscaviarum]
MGKDFSKVRAGDKPAATSRSSTTATASGSGRGIASVWADASPSRRRLYVLLAAVLVLVVVLVMAKVIGGGGEDDVATAPSFGTVHGPTHFDNGIPSGYTRDRGGAATAAVNLVQSLARVKPGQVDTLQSALIGRDPSSTLKVQLERAKDPSPSAQHDVLNTVPATVTVQSLTEDVAEISVWTLTADQFVLNAAGQKSLQVIWSTTDLKMVWQDGDWKAIDLRFRTGPEPGEAAAPSNSGQPIETGYYSFFVN